MIYRTPLKALVIGFGLLALVGCSSTGSDAENASNIGTDVTGSGIGVEGTFNGIGACTKEIKNQTYYFDFNKSEIRSGDRECIEAQAKFLTANPQAKLLLEGHTDPRGSREYNIALGERRADAVADAFKLLGVAPSQIRVVSYGAEKLASNGTSEDDYQLDRRVNLVYEAK
ncbi:MAG: OmpA family protein [Gammaproteobacteria bacterium]